MQGKQKKKKERRNIITRTGSNIYFSPEEIIQRNPFFPLLILPRVIYIYSQVLVRGKIERTNSKKLGVKRWKKFIEVYFLIDSNLNEKL